MVGALAGLGQVDEKVEKQTRGAPLNGWRGVAAYLGRNQSTVKRWAATRDLPVHRPHGGEARKGVPVYAFPDELDAWIRGHPDELLETATEPAKESSGAWPVEAAVSNRRPPNRRRLTFGLAAMGLAASGAGLVAWRYADGGGTAQIADEARALHVEAAYLWQKRTPESLQQAADLLKRALEIEPAFAAAHADRAIVYNLMVEYGVTGVDEGYELSRMSAERAILLDPSNARAHSVLGDILFFWNRDYEGGARLLERAAKFDPRDATARHWFASVLMAQGHYGEAAVEIAAARELEPLSRSIVVSQAMIELGRASPEVARQLLGQLVRNEPGYRSPYRFLAFAELALGNYPEYLAALTQRFLLTDDPAGLDVAEAGQRGWRSGGFEQMVEAMISAARANPVTQKDPYFVAHWHALAGAWADAADHLARTPTRRFAYYGIDPAFADARQDADFREKIIAAGLPAIW
ncbi:hypothetical protein ASD64_02600 [Mesorhizobium sp. Root157]|nr:hypothetical protein ASD64_02600 [Mesorhizobium sp. Root157]